jgi:hypothetical protein
LTLSTGFGSSALGNVNVMGAALNDLVVSQPCANKLFIYTDGTPASGFNSFFTINGPPSVPSWAFYDAVADFNGDSAQDIFATETGPTPAAWGLFNKAGTFENQAGTAFWFSKFYTGITGTSRTVSIAVGDFDGDTHPDVAIGDRFATPGKVFVWH